MSGARLVGGEQLQKDLRKLSPARRKVTDAALLESGLLVLRTAAQRKIRRGGGKGSPPVQGILTSRTGTLRRSLGPDLGLDRSGLSRGFIEVGTSLVYGAVHENSTSAPRPFLSPALDDEISSFESIFVKHWKKGAGL